MANSKPCAAGALCTAAGTLWLNGITHCPLLLALCPLLLVSCPLVLDCCLLVLLLQSMLVSMHKFLNPVYCLPVFGSAMYLSARPPPAAPLCPPPPQYIGCVAPSMGLAGHAIGSRVLYDSPVFLVCLYAGAQCSDNYSCSCPVGCALVPADD